MNHAPSSVQQFRHEAFGEYDGAQHIALQGEFVGVDAFLAFRHNATGVVDHSINAIKALGEFLCEISHVVERIKITDKRRGVDALGDCFGALGVTAHHRYSPGTARQFPGYFSTDSAACSGDNGRTVHGTLSLMPLV